MKSARSFPRWTVLILPAVFSLAAPSPGGEVVSLPWREYGIREKLGGYRPHALPLSTEEPAGLVRKPAGIASPLFGSFAIGPAAAPAVIRIAVDLSNGTPVRLFVDGNANGDLADDPAGTWTEKKSRRPDGTVSSTWFGDAMITIPFASGPRKAHVLFYRLTPRAATGQAPPETIFYYSDYGRAGDIKVGGKTIAAVLDDAGCTGDFNLSGGMMKTPLLGLDLDANGLIRGQGELMLATRPFEIGGAWWAVTNMTADGVFEIVPAEKPAATAPAAAVGPDLSPGKSAPSFTAKLTGGAEVKFPDDFKGKVVLLDFWATWCGPCVAEIPNLVKAYETYHQKGLEILGISLDREGAEQKLADFTRGKGMPWPQVYDGKGWKAGVAQQYGIHAIPHMLLVDGDTGTILADKTIRGAALAPAIEKALSERK